METCKQCGFKMGTGHSKEECIRAGYMPAYKITYRYKNSENVWSELFYEPFAQGKCNNYLNAFKKILSHYKVMDCRTDKILDSKGLTTNVSEL